MKKTLVALLLLFPMISQAQKLELSLKGGVNINNIVRDKMFAHDIEKPLGYSGSAAVTIGLPANVRVGVSISAYQMEYSAIFADDLYPGTKIEDIPRSTYKYGSPVMPIEIMALKRFNVAMVSIDAGVIGGAMFTNTVSIEEEGYYREFKFHDKGPWYTYGLIVGAQVNISKNFAVGAEAQPKRLHINYWGVKNVFVMPVMLKASVRI